MSSMNSFSPRKSPGERQTKTAHYSYVETITLTRIDCEGKPFDPNLHQAVMQTSAKDLEPNTIVQVIEQGFLNQDRV